MSDEKPPSSSALAPDTSTSTRSPARLHPFSVRRVKAGVDQKPEGSRFETRLLAIEEAEGLDVGADEVIEVLERDTVVWTRPRR